MSAKDTSFSVSEALSAEDVKAGKTPAQKTLFIPKDTTLYIDIVNVHYNRESALAGPVTSAERVDVDSHIATYWEDPTAFKPERFLDPDWPRDAFLPFVTGPRACLGRRCVQRHGVSTFTENRPFDRFAEVEAIAIISFIIRQYSICIDSAKFKEIAGETLLERRERFLAIKFMLTTTPLSVPLVFKRREQL